MFLWQKNLWDLARGPEAGEGSEEPEVKIGETVEEGVKTETPEPTPEPKAEAKPRPWFEKRIDSLTAAKYELERALEAERAARAAPVAPKGEEEEKVAPDRTPTPPPTRMYTAEEARQIAQAEAATISFNERCNEAASAGKAEYPDFMDAVGALNTKLGGMTTTFVEAALETGLAPKIIYSLGKDLDKAAEIMALSPVKQAVAIAKFAAELAKPAKKEVSKAPEPISPQVGGGGKGSGDLEDSNVPIDQWMRMRKAQLSNKR